MFHDFLLGMDFCDEGGANGVLCWASSGSFFIHQLAVHQLHVWLPTLVLAALVVIMSFLVAWHLKVICAARPMVRMREMRDGFNAYERRLLEKVCYRGSFEYMAPRRVESFSV